MMADLHFTHGDGQLLRTANVVLFCRSHHDQLSELVEGSETIDVKALVSLIVSHDFSLPPFVVIGTQQRKIFVFGEILVDIDGDALDGSTTTTGIEQPLTTASIIRCGDGTPIHGQLGAGWVNASGFTLSLTNAASASTRQAVDEQLKDEEQVVDEPGAASVAIVEPEPEPTPEPEPEPEPEPDGEWDPLADPEIGLESIGAPEIVDELPPPPPPPTDMPKVSNESDVELAEEPEVEDSPIGLIPPPPQGMPLIASIHGENSDPTLPVPAFAEDETTDAEAGHILRFDDGQKIEIEVGAYVGRHPTKNGLPDGYTSATIRGEHVSRVHWEIAIQDDSAVLRDLGSSGGTEVEVNGGRIPVPVGGMVIAAGTTIHFADRYAVYESE